MIVYAIKDATTGEWWSHNGWGKTTSVPRSILYTRQGRIAGVQKGQVRIHVYMLMAGTPQAYYR